MRSPARMARSARARLRRDVYEAGRWLRQLSRAVRRVDDRALIERYLEHAESLKLHLGCGYNVLPGWLNVDFAPQRDEVAKLDATQRFPLPSQRFDFVVSEHFIEHFSYADGERILRECLRVLRPGGTMRISTPDLGLLVRLFGETKSAEDQRYQDWSCHKVVDWAPYSDPAFVLNHFVRAWGHRFVYTKPVLRELLIRIGFVEITEQQLNESAAPPLVGLENESRLPAGFLRLETFTLEARRPRTLP